MSSRKFPLSTKRQYGRGTPSDHATRPGAACFPARREQAVTDGQPPSPPQRTAAGHPPFPVPSGDRGNGKGVRGERPDKAGKNERRPMVNFVLRRGAGEARTRSRRGMTGTGAARKTEPGGKKGAAAAKKRTTRTADHQSTKKAPHAAPPRDPRPDRPPTTGQARPGGRAGDGRAPETDGSSNDHQGTETEQHPPRHKAGHAPGERRTEAARRTKSDSEPTTRRETRPRGQGRAEEKGAGRRQQRQSRTRGGQLRRPLGAERTENEARPPNHRRDKPEEFGRRPYASGCAAFVQAATAVRDSVRQ